MAVSVSPGETILWDQIQYTGNPSDFVWMLPVGPDAVVEVADAGFFEALSRETALTLRGPAFVCPCGPGASAAGTVSPAGVEAGPLAVAMPADPDAMEAALLYRAVVGPYETVTLRGSGDEIVDWRGYAVPEAVRPVLTHYAERGSSFVVLRLAPGVGVDQMQPVRVRMPGVSLSLPLRMVAAGAGDTVELELFVIAEGRMEASSFGNAEVARSRLEYDATRGRFDYDTLFDEALFQGSSGPTNWVTENAMPLPVELLSSYASAGPDGAVHRAGPDVALAIDRLDAPYLTRLRTRLQRTDLERELTLRASASDDVDRLLLATVENLPTCEVADTPLPDGGFAIVRTPRPRTCACRTSSAEPPTLGALLVFAALLRRRRAAR
jgi:MYXO-CTERM domain-containing protein